MMRFDARLFLVASLALSGCAGGLMHNQKETATREWNHARVDAMAGLAADQFKEGSFEKCEDTLAKALMLEPNNVSLRLLAAKLALEQNRLDVADAQLREARRIDPSNAEADYLTGVVLQRWQHPEEARLAYAEAASKNAGELSYVMAQAEMLVVLGRGDEALALLKLSISAFDHSAVLRDAVGQLLVAQKRPEDAVAYFREAARLAGDDTGPREHLAFALLATKSYADAADVFDRLANASGFEKRADIRAGLAECQGQTQQFDAARKNYDLAVQLSPAVAGYWLGLARTCAQGGDLPAADVAVRRATSIDPRSGEAQCLLGTIRLKQNQLPAALVAFRAAAELSPADSLPLCLAGYTLTKLGQLSEAQACFKKARQIDPNDPVSNAVVIASVQGD